MLRCSKRRCVPGAPSSSENKKPCPSSGTLLESSLPRSGEACVTSAKCPIGTGSHRARFVPCLSPHERRSFKKKKKNITSPAVSKVSHPTLAVQRVVEGAHKTTSFAPISSSSALKSREWQSATDDLSNPRYITICIHVLYYVYYICRYDHV